MENKGTGDIQAGNLAAGRPMVLGSNLAYDPEELAIKTSHSQPVVSGGPIQAAQPSSVPNGFKRFVRRFIIIVIIILLIGGGVIWIVGSRSTTQDNSATGGQSNTVEIPLSDLVTGDLDAAGTRGVTINGPLTLNDTLILTPQAQPVQAVAGQMYYDQTSNQLAYYNGTQFVSLGGVQVVSVTSGSPTLTVVNDGAGHLTITSTAGGGGTGTVASTGGTVGRIAKFTGAQNIADSLLSEAGTTLTVGGDLAVTGSVGLSTPLSVVNGGTGASTVAVNGVVIGQGTGALTAVTAAGPGLCFLSTAGAPAFSACPSGATDTFLQNGNSFAAPAVLGTNDNNSLSFETNGATVATFATNGSLLLQNTADSTTAFNVKTSLSNNVLTVDTVNARLGLGLGSSTVPSLFGRGMQISGALRLSGSSDTDVLDNHYLTPVNGDPLFARFNIENEVLASGRALVYMGLNATSDVASRGLVVLDARSGSTAIHQPSIGVISPDESQIAGFSWDGSNAAFLIKNSASGSIGLNVAGTTRLAGTTTGATVTGNFLPDAANADDLGSSTLEFNQLFLGDNNGIKLGADQDATIAYDEATDDRVEITGTNASLFVEDRLSLGVDARTIADNGAGTNATLTLTPASSYVTVTCNDANGCDITMGEGSAKDGDTLFIVSTGTNAVNFADTSGVSELNSTFAAGQYDSISMLYVGDRWVEVARSNN